MAEGSKEDRCWAQSAVIPYRKAGKGWEVMLVTSRSGKRWVIPKGLCEPGMTAAESAAKEAYEEAGLRGAVDDRGIGSYKYQKWGGVCEVEVFLMRVKKELAQWPESNIRDRAWLSSSDAAEQVSEKKLAGWLRRLSELIEKSVAS
jgi:phosphohistidine phosphatase